MESWTFGSLSVATFSATIMKTKCSGARMDQIPVGRLKIIIFSEITDRMAGHESVGMGLAVSGDFHYQQNGLTLDRICKIYRRLYFHN